MIPKETSATKLLIPVEAKSDHRSYAIMYGVLLAFIIWRHKRYPIE